MKKKITAASPFVFSISLYYFILPISTTSSSPSTLRGVHPLDFEYYAAEVIKCKDGSDSFAKTRLNDNFCDCFDGTDEPENCEAGESEDCVFDRWSTHSWSGTSACPKAKFYCKNLGSQPRFLFSSCVNDHICDCCDGSDEYDGDTSCPNTCIMGSSIQYNAEYHHVTKSNKLQANEKKEKGSLDDMIRNLKDLKVLAVIQLIIIAFWASFLIRRRMKSGRQRH